MKINDTDRLFLLTNDDGIDAPGIKLLLEELENFGKVVMISSADVMSSMSQAITIREPLTVKLLDETDKHCIYVTNGTPADNVKLTINSLIERKPDYVVAGVNLGSNSSVSVLYSGTMAAVIEGCLYGIDSVGFSLNSFSHDADYSVCRKYIRLIMSKIIATPLPGGVCLNVNIPAVDEQKIKGIKICRQTAGNWIEKFEKQVDAHGNVSYWLKGTFSNHEPEAEDTDEWALANNYVSIVPVNIDMTDYEYMETLKKEMFQYGLRG